ncbi:MAG: hypothetical protein AVDCRST_MAG86-1295, partial [uncultured Truepera sp.]
AVRQRVLRRQPGKLGQPLLWQDPTNLRLGYERARPAHGREARGVRHPRPQPQLSRSQQRREPLRSNHPRHLDRPNGRRGRYTPLVRDRRSWHRYGVHRQGRWYSREDAHRSRGERGRRPTRLRALRRRSKRRSAFYHHKVFAVSEPRL